MALLRDPTREPTIEDLRQELYTLSGTKRMIRTNKMKSVLEKAFKAIDFYKDVVVQVEVFIHKMGPLHQMSGLYILDAIIRASKQKFGEKDVFAAEFAKKIKITMMRFSLEAFRPLWVQYESKIMSMLNRWEERKYFPPGVVLKIKADLLCRGLIMDVDSDVDADFDADMHSACTPPLEPWEVQPN